MTNSDGQIYYLVVADEAPFLTYAGPLQVAEA
jgi:hypothetical protein